MIPLFLTTLPLLMSIIIASLGLASAIRGLIKEDTKQCALLGLLLGLLAVGIYILFSLLFITFGFD